MNTMIPNLNATMTQAGNGIAFGMRASDGYAQSVMELPCSFAGAVVNGPTWKRHADVAIEHDQGTLVWSPPT